MLSIPCYNYGSFGLQQLYDMVHNGPGAAGAEPAIHSLTGLASIMGGSSGRIQAALSGSGVSWQGQAADAATSAMQRMGQWAEHGGQVSGTGSDKIQDYASSFADLQSKVLAPTPVPSPTSWESPSNIIGNTYDYAQAVVKNHQAETQAHAALEAHEQNTRRALAGFPDTDTVPVVTNAAPVAPSGGELHPSTSSNSASSVRGDTASSGLTAGSDTSIVNDSTPGSRMIGDVTPSRATPRGTGADKWTPLAPPANGTGLGAKASPNESGNVTVDPSGFYSGVEGSPRPSRLSASSRTARATPKITQSSPVAEPSPGRQGNPAPRRAPLTSAEDKWVPLAEADNSSARRQGPSIGGIAPSAPGNGLRGQHREHRNSTYLASDSPYVDDGDDGAVPAVLSGEETSS